MEQPAGSFSMSGSANAMNANAPAFVLPSSLKATAAEYTPPFRKEIFGAVVEFGPGGTVVSIKLPTDFSSVQVRSNLPAFHLRWRGQNLPALSASLRQGRHHNSSPTFL